MGNDKGSTLVEASQVEIEGNVEQIGEEFHISKRGATISIKFPETIYINKLQFYTICHKSVKHT